MTMPALPGGLAPSGPSMDYYIPQWEERTSYGMRRVDPYTKLFEDRIIFLGTPISDDIANAVMAERIRAINPECQVHVVDDFVTADNMAEHIHNDFDYVIDAIVAAIHPLEGQVLVEIGPGLGALTENHGGAGSLLRLTILGVIMLRLRNQETSTPIPFGPYLAIAGWIALLWGDQITATYLQFAGFR